MFGSSSIAAFQDTKTGEVVPLFEVMAPSSNKKQGLSGSPLFNGVSLSHRDVRIKPLGVSVEQLSLASLKTDLYCLEKEFRVDVVQNLVTFVSKLPVECDDHLVLLFMEADILDGLEKMPYFAKSLVEAIAEARVPALIQAMNGLLERLKLGEESFLDGSG